MHAKVHSTLNLVAHVVGTGGRWHIPWVLYSCCMYLGRHKLRPRHINRRCVLLLLLLLLEELLELLLLLHELLGH